MSAARPLVSVIVPVFDAARHLPATLRSIVRQSWRPLEVVLWDDGSRDRSPHIIAAFARAARARGIACTVGAHAGGKNRGPAVTRNEAVAASQGALLQFLDADDLLPPRKVEVHARALAARPDLDAVTCGATVFCRFRGAPWLARWWSLECPDVRAALCHINPFPPHAPLIRRETFARAGGFDPTLDHVQDHDFWFRAAVERGARFERADERGTLAVFYRRHAANFSRDRRVMARWDAAVRERIARWALAEGEGWEVSGAAYALAATARELARGGDGALAARSVAAVPDLLARLEVRPPRDWRPAWDKAWAATVEALFRAPAIPEEALRRFAAWAARHPGPAALRSARARLARHALARFAAAPADPVPRALLARAAHFRSLGIARALARGGPWRLVAAAVRASWDDLGAAADRLRPFVS